jgi:hypothetical protein
VLKGSIYLPAGVLIRQVFSFSDVRFQNIALHGGVADDSVALQEAGLTDFWCCFGGDYNRPGMRILASLCVCDVCVRVMCVCV